jgi:hypothetical protein
MLWRDRVPAGRWIVPAVLGLSTFPAVMGDPAEADKRPADLVLHNGAVWAGDGGMALAYPPGHATCPSGAAPAR